MGRYSFDNLAPGYYEVSIAKTGFDTVTRTLNVGPNTEPLDVTLAIGFVSTTVTVIDVAGKATASRLDIPDRDLPVQVTVILETGTVGESNGTRGKRRDAEGANGPAVAELEPDGDAN